MSGVVKYHVNNEGEAGVCKSVNGKCPFGGPARHFVTAEDARAFYESTQNTFTPKGVQKMTKAKPFEAPIYTPFLTNGYTENINSLLKDVEQVDIVFERYRKYRATGLNEAEYQPFIQPHLKNYLDEYTINNAWQNLDKQVIAHEYTRALREYYLDNIFNERDIDCLPDDDEIVSKLLDN